VVGVSPAPTTVTVRAAGHLAADPGGRWGALAPGDEATFTVARGEVAQLVGAPPPPCTSERPGYSPAELCLEPEHDPSGTRVISDRPIAAFSGHVCAFVPFDTPACDHLETQLTPVRTWGERFEAMTLREPGSAATDLLRVFAARDGTRVTLSPPVGGLAEAIVDAAAPRELRLDGATAIDADGPIQVTQLMQGQHQTDPPLPRGDPSLTVLVPLEQHRYEYVFITPTSYADTPDGRAYVLVARDAGVPITLDGQPLDAEWTRLGDRELAVVPVGGGAHRAESGAPFGLVAFGFGLYTSYAHPAGLDLRILD